MREKIFKGVVVCLVAVVAPVIAITFGEPDGNGHPFVGLVVFYSDTAAHHPLWRCTGTLIGPQVLLTAGHCTGDPVEPPLRAQVWFDSIVGRPPYPYTGGVLGTPIPHPDFPGYLALPNTHDVGVVLLDTPVTGKGFGTLPTEGVLDGLATRRGLQDVSFKVVGYGLQGVKPVEISIRERYRGWTKLNNLRSALTDGYSIHLSNNPGNWSGGTCFGDSGGPTFLNNTNTVVAVTSFGLNQNCAGAGFAYRIDIADARDFLEHYVTLP